METIITVILVHNILLFQFLGADLMVDKRLKEVSPLSVLIVGVFSTAIVSLLTYIVHLNVLQKFDLQYMMPFVFALCLIVSAFLVDFAFKKLFTFMHESLKDLIYILSFSTLIFGVCLMNIQKFKTLSLYVYMNVLYVLGFVLIYYLINTIGKKIVHNPFPKYVYPLTIIFVLLGILSMAFKGLANAFY